MINPDELKIPWKPLKELYIKIVQKNEIGMYRYFAHLDGTLKGVIILCKTYFPIEATQEILDEWRPKLCPFSVRDMAQAVDALSLFLPTCVKPEYASQTYGLWLKEMMDLWNTCHNSSTWENVSKLSKRA